MVRVLGGVGVRAGAVALVTLALAACGSSPVAPTPKVPSQHAACVAAANFGPAAQSLYVLPYPVGIHYSVFQSYCEVGTGHENRLATDFLMPDGSAVTAARAGEVVAVVDQWPDSDSTSDHFNLVYIRHDDGSAACYIHLQLASIVVSVGDRVNVGQPLGKSGHSGTRVPHLHFGVYRTWPAADGQDLAINFRNADGPLDARGGPIAGTVYTALPY